MCQVVSLTPRPWLSLQNPHNTDLVGVCASPDQSGRCGKKQKRTRRREPSGMGHYAERFIRSSMLSNWQIKKSTHSYACYDSSKFLKPGIRLNSKFEADRIISFLHSHLHNSTHVSMYCCCCIGLHNKYRTFETSPYLYLFINNNVSVSMYTCIYNTSDTYKSSVSPGINIAWKGTENCRTGENL